MFLRAYLVALASSLVIAQTGGPAVAVAQTYEVVTLAFTKSQKRPAGPIAIALEGGDSTWFLSYEKLARLLRSF
jgi:hypothetical protein